MTNPYEITTPVAYDLEVYPGWFEAGFKTPDGLVWQYVVSDDATPEDNAQAVLGLTQFLNRIQFEGSTLVGFNSNSYDDLVLTAFLRDPRPEVAYQTSVSIIHDEVPRWKFDNDINSVDLMPVLPGRMSLKKIGVCLGHKRLQELPVPWHEHPTPEQQQTLLPYNINDLDITAKLYWQIKAEIDLRVTMSEQYGVDLRSKGEATLAETILLHEYARLGGQLTKKKLNDQAWGMINSQPMVWVQKPSWWEALVEDAPDPGPLTQLGAEIFSAAIPVNHGKMSSDAMNRQVYLDDRYYAMGVGGLHSVDGPGAWVPNEDQVLFDIDVTGYYPNIILTQALYPRPWGPMFLDIYRDIVNRRTEAKHSGDAVTAAVLKIASNGTYGKSSDVYSALFDPQLTANVTVLGQLGLLALIQMLKGLATVCSANTDGITVLCGKGAVNNLKSIVSRWESATGLDMEYTEYKALYQLDVNNYIAIKADGSAKAKGRFIDQWPDLRHTPSANIVATAIKEALKDNTPVEETIYASTDINQFILTQNASKDFTTSWHDQPLGNVLRFYKSVRDDAAPIYKHKDGESGKVSDSDGCVPLEDLPDQFPADIDYAWYVRKAMTTLTTLRQPKRPGMTRWAELLHQNGLRPCMVDPDKALSRAAVKYGEVDFTSLPPGWQMGTGTGGGILAQVHDDLTRVWTVDHHYPSKTRKLIKRDEGFELIYGARVPLTGMVSYYAEHTWSGVDLTVACFDQYYTPAELKKVGR